MSELLRTHPRSARPMRKPCPSHHDFDGNASGIGYEWKLPPEEPHDGLHFKMRDFCELFDHGSDEYRPAVRREEKYRYPRCDDARNEVIDLRKSKKDLPTAGQIIWDDIGEGMMVESLSWSQSDVEREIESWDQRLKETDGKCQRNVAWDDGDMIRFEDPRDVYLPRRSGSIGYQDGRWRNSRGNVGSLQRYDKSFPESQRDGKNVRKTKCDEVLKKPSVVDTSEILPAPLKDNVRFNLNRGQEESRHSCSHSYSSYKQVT